MVNRYKTISNESEQIQSVASLFKPVFRRLIINCDPNSFRNLLMAMLRYANNNFVHKNLEIMNRERIFYYRLPAATSENYCFWHNRSSKDSLDSKVHFLPLCTIVIIYWNYASRHDSYSLA